MLQRVRPASREQDEEHSDKLFHKKIVRNDDYCLGVIEAYSGKEDFRFHCSRSNAPFDLME
jgi:hypothetical protein